MTRSLVLCAVLLLLLALAAGSWRLLGEDGGGSVPVGSPRPSVAPLPELAEALVRVPVVVAVPSTRRESDLQSPLPGEGDRALGTAAAREVAAPRLDDLSELDFGALRQLEQALTQELNVSTVDELRWRFRHGLGELAGTGDDFDIAAAWDHERIMQMVSPGDGTHWRVALPREGYPAAYALWDRRAAVRSELELRRSRGERWRPYGGRTEPERTARE